MFLPIINFTVFSKLSHILDHDNYFINKKIKVFFYYRTETCEPTVFDQGRPQLAGELFGRFVMIGTVVVLKHGF